MSLVLPQLPSHVFVVKVLVTFVKDSIIYLNCDGKFLFVSSPFVFDLIIWEAIQQNIQSNAIRAWFHNIFFFFPSLPLRKKNLCKGLRTTQSLTENANEWPHLRRFYANVREWINIWLDPRRYVEKYANLNAVLMDLYIQKIWFDGELELVKLYKNLDKRQV